MRYQDLGQQEEPAAALSPQAGPAAAHRHYQDDEDAIPLSDLSPAKRASSPHAEARHDHQQCDTEGQDDIDGSGADHPLHSGCKRPRQPSDHHQHHHHHHRRQSSAVSDATAAAAAATGVSTAFCATYPFRRLIFQTLGKDRVFQLLYFLAGPLLFGMTLAIGAHNRVDAKMVCTVATTLLMVVWFLFECLPIGITSFIPAVLFPLMGVVPGSRVAFSYFSDQVLILFGSCMLAAAVEEYKLHRRLALAILSRAGRSPYRLVLGFLSATAFLSMWLSNTATAAMMAPLASAVMETLSAGAETPAHDDAAIARGQTRRLLSSSSDDGEGEEEEEVEIELPATGAGGPPLPPPRSFSLDERGHGSLSGGSDGERRLRGRTEDPGAFRRREEGEGMVEINLWAGQQDGEGAGEFWCGIRKSQIEFAISLAICYGASLGGMATLTGTSTNLVLNGVLGSSFSGAVPISFGTFILIAGPIALAALVALWVYLCWKMRMESVTPPTLLEHADWKDYLRIALHNLTPRGYHPPTSLRGRDGNAVVEDDEASGSSMENEFAREYRRLKPMSWEEKVIVGDFVAIALLWFFRDPKGYPGWTSLLPEPAYVTDGTIALMGAMALFVIPRKDFFQPPATPGPSTNGHARVRTQEDEEDDSGRGRSGRSRCNSAASTASRRGAARPTASTEPFGVLPWQLVLQRMPWDVLFLVGGGLALSLAFKESKLSRMIATAFAGLESLPFPFVVFSVIVVVILVSNFISNVACANIILPPLGCIAVSLGRHPLALMLPATLAGSFAFISPIATPANAIAFSLGTLTASELARVGSVLTVLSVCMLVLLFPPLFGALIDGKHVPTWAYAGC